MENEMIILAAKAIRGVLIANGIDANTGFGLFISEQCSRAAIDAIRVPTEAIVNAMERNHDYRFSAHETYGSVGIQKETCAEIYTAMIDAALKSE